MVTWLHITCHMRNLFGKHPKKKRKEKNRKYFSKKLKRRKDPTIPKKEWACWPGDLDRYKIQDIAHYWSLNKFRSMCSDPDK